MKTMQLSDDTQGEGFCKPRFSTSTDDYKSNNELVRQ